MLHIPTHSISQYTPYPSTPHIAALSISRYALHPAHSIFEYKLYPITLHVAVHSIFQCTAYPGTLRALRIWSVIVIDHGVYLDMMSSGYGVWWEMERMYISYIISNVPHGMRKDMECTKIWSVLTYPPCVQSPLPPYTLSPIKEQTQCSTQCMWAGAPPRVYKWRALQFCKPQKLKALQFACPGPATGSRVSTGQACARQPTSCQQSANCAGGA